MKKVLLFLIVLSFASVGYSHGDEDHSAKKMKQSMGKTKVVEVEIGKKGFQPAKIDLKKGENLVLNVTRKTNKTCMKKLKHPVSGQLVDLPKDQMVEIVVGSFDEKKKMDLLCGMGMKAGVVQVN